MFGRAHAVLVVAAMTVGACIVVKEAPGEAPAEAELDAGTDLGGDARGDAAPKPTTPDSGTPDDAAVNFATCFQRTPVLEDGFTSVNPAWFAQTNNAPAPTTDQSAGNPGPGLTMSIPGGRKDGSSAQSFSVGDVDAFALTFSFRLQDIGPGLLSYMQIFSDTGGLLEGRVFLSRGENESGAMVNVRDAPGFVIGTLPGSTWFEATITAARPSRTEPFVADVSIAGVGKGRVSFGPLASGAKVGLQFGLNFSGTTQRRSDGFYDNVKIWVCGP